MSTMFQVHNCKSIRVESLYHDNARSLALMVERLPQDGGNVEFSTFDLPDDVIDRIIQAFGEPRRCSYTHEQTVYPAEMKALQRERDDLLVKVRKLNAENADLTLRLKAQSREGV